MSRNWTIFSLLGCPKPIEIIAARRKRNIHIKMKHLPFWWPTEWCSLLIYWFPERDLLIGKLDLGESDTPLWSLLEFELIGRSDPLELPISCRACSMWEFEDDLLCEDEDLAKVSADWRRAPTTPTSRLIAPTFAVGLESRDGTWTGSEKDE